MCKNKNKATSKWALLSAFHHARILCPVPGPLAVNKPNALAFINRIAISDFSRFLYIKHKDPLRDWSPERGDKYERGTTYKVITKILIFAY